MSRMSEYLIEIQEYICNALDNGAGNETDIFRYIREYYPDFYVTQDFVSGAYELYLDQQWNELEVMKLSPL